MTLISLVLARSGRRDRLRLLLWSRSSEILDGELAALGQEGEINPRTSSVSLQGTVRIDAKVRSSGSAVSEPPVVEACLTVGPALADPALADAGD
jgi:hypothetical protein